MNAKATATAKAKAKPKPAAAAAAAGKTRPTDNEAELRSLMSRVMSGPLDPLQEKMDSMEARIVKLEGVAEANRVAMLRVGEAIGASQADLRKRLAGQVDGLQTAICEQVDSLGVQMAAQDQQQKSVLVTLDAVRNEASARGTTLLAAVAVCQESLSTSLGRLDDLRTMTVAAETNHAVTREESLERVRELRIAADAAAARHDEALSALQVGQAFTSEALAQQHEQSVEIKESQRAQQEAALAIPALLGTLRADFETAQSRRMEVALQSILSGTDAQGAKRQEGMLAQFKLLRTLTVLNLLALAGICGLAVFQFLGRG
jgi:hypothetical protein